MFWNVTLPNLQLSTETAGRQPSDASLFPWVPPLVRRGPSFVFWNVTLPNLQLSTETAGRQPSDASLSWHQPANCWRQHCLQVHRERLDLLHPAGKRDRICVVRPCLKKVRQPFRDLLSTGVPGCVTRPVPQCFMMVPSDLPCLWSRGPGARGALEA